MKLISKIEIVGVRSIRDATILTTGSFNTFVGKNSSGKSNVLRALNLFFNGELDPDSEIDFSRDHYEREPRIRSKKRIAVTVHFDLPEEFNVRTGLEDLAELGRQFSIKREWTLDPSLGPVEEFSVYVNEQLQDHSDMLAQQFLSLINYRYIPNYINPVELLKAESKALAKLVLGRLGRDAQTGVIMNALSDSAERVLADANDALSATGAPLVSPTMFDGDSLAEFLTTNGFQALGAHGLSVSDEDWGSGHQSFFMFQVMKLLDTNYRRHFGWRQATIWGIEEPETSLHRDLETRLAGVLREWSDTSSCRIQVFVTSHSSVFLTAAEVGFLVSLPEKETVISSEPISRLARNAEAYGVTQWMHPVLSFPFNPVVLVEGPTDEDALGHLSRLIGLSHIRFVTAPKLQGENQRAGVGSIMRFLQHAGKYIPNRVEGCPLCVLLDWDVSDQELEQVRSRYGELGGQYVFRMNAGLAHDSLSDDFRGIERFYGPFIIQESIDAGELISVRRPNGTYAVTPVDLERAKRRLCNRILSIQNPEDRRLLHLKRLLVDLAQMLLPGDQLNLSLI